MKDTNCQPRAFRRKVYPSVCSLEACVVQPHQGFLVKYSRTREEMNKTYQPASYVGRIKRQMVPG